VPQLSHLYASYMPVEWHYDASYMPMDCHAYAIGRFKIRNKNKKKNGS
jgi:hypothetical protein